MAQFATADDLAARLGLELTEDEETRADALLETVSGLIQDETGQTIELVEDDELVMAGTNDDRIVLPQRPVVEVASVSVGDVPLGAGSWYIDGNAIARVPCRGRVNGYGTGFGSPSRTLTIVYTHGYDDDAIPGLIKAITVEAVVRAWVNPGSVVAETVGDTQTTYAPYSDPPRGLMLTDAEKRSLRRRFGRRAASITVEV